MIVLNLVEAIIFCQRYYFKNSVPSNDLPSLSGVEVMCGTGGVVQALWRREKKALGYDYILNNKLHDFVSVEGFLVLISYVLGIEESNGILHWDTLCSTWIFMSRLCYYY